MTRHVWFAFVSPTNCSYHCVFHRSCGRRWLDFALLHCSFGCLIMSMINKSKCVESRMVNFCMSWLNLALSSGITLTLLESEVLEAFSCKCFTHFSRHSTFWHVSPLFLYFTSVNRLKLIWQSKNKAESIGYGLVSLDTPMVFALLVTTYAVPGLIFSHSSVPMSATMWFTWSVTSRPHSKPLSTKKFVGRCTDQRELNKIRVHGAMHLLEICVLLMPKLIPKDNTVRCNTDYQNFCCN